MRLEDPGEGASDGGRHDPAAAGRSGPRLLHVSSRTIISLEKEQYSPSLMLAYRLALVFGVAVEDLCCLEENLKAEDQKYEDLS